MTIDERIEALTMNFELQARESETLRERMKAQSQEAADRHLRVLDRIDNLTHLIEIDADNIRSLARIAEAHQGRLDRVEGLR